MDKKIIKNLDISKPEEKLILQLRANIGEDWDLVEDVDVPEEIKQLAFQEIFRESVKRAYKDFENK